MTDYKFETRQLHAGHVPDTDTASRAVPIHMTASYLFEDTQVAADIFSMEKSGYTYSRTKNPTTNVFEERMASLEKGTHAVATASGMAAQMITFCSLARSGDNIVSTQYLYGGSTVQCKYTLDRIGIHTKFVDSESPEAFAQAIDDRTRALYIETIANPKLMVMDIRSIADVAASHGIPLVIDNTFGAGGYICTPLSWGANIIVHSATKWIGGHGTVLGGVVIDGGNFNWDNGKFSNLSAPSPMHNGMVFWDKFGPKSGTNTAFGMFTRSESLKHLGPVLSPFNAFLLLQGLETLSLRVERHCDNAMILAKWLRLHPKVDWVWYPGLEDSPYHEHAKKYFRKGLFGSMLSFGVKGGERAGRVAIENLSLVSHLANVGDAKTLAIHPASTTHSQLNEKDLTASGVRKELIRVSVGIEHIDDIIADFDDALAKA